MHTRFPPEPNGYLHVGHAKSITINFGLAREFGGKCNLRFDDTNPSKEETEYVDSIIEDVRWLGGDLEDRLFYASDYFDQLYDWAVQLIQKGKAYVCDLTADQVRQQRGTLTEPGQESPYRNRSDRRKSRPVRAHAPGRVSRRLADLARQDRHGLAQSQHARSGDVPHSAHADHHRTGDKWCIYPMYDFAHGQSDSIERITHSICTLEFEDHRPLYDWFIEQLGIYHPQQIEFDRLNLTYTLLSKRKLLALVQNKLVSGWDDPRMPTISGMRRRGYTPEALRNFCGRIGVSKTNGITELSLLEYFVREDLNRRAARVMAVLRPLRVVIDNYPEGQVEHMEAVNNPEDPSMGTRQVPFSKVLYIEQDDFREDPPKQYFRLAPGREVRLRYALLHHLHRRGEGRRRQCGRAALHLRSGHQGRQRARRPQGEVDHPLGFGGARRRRRGSHLRNAVQLRRSQRGSRRPGFHRQSESEFARSRIGREARAQPARCRAGKSLSVRAAGLFLRSIPTALARSWCSTAPSRCATPGPRSRRNPK